MCGVTEGMFGSGFDFSFFVFASRNVGVEQIGVVDFSKFFEARDVDSLDGTNTCADMWDMVNDEKAGSEKELISLGE